MKNELFKIRNISFLLKNILFQQIIIPVFTRNTISNMDLEKALDSVPHFCKIKRVVVNLFLLCRPYIKHT